MRFDPCIVSVISVAITHSLTHSLRAEWHKGPLLGFSSHHCPGLFSLLLTTPFQLLSIPPAFLLHVLRGRPLYLLPSGVHVRAILAWADGSILRVGLTHRHRFLLENSIHWFLFNNFQEIIIGNSIWPENPHNSSQAGGMEVLSLLRYFAIICKHSAPYNSTGRTFLLYIPSLVAQL